VLLDRERVKTWQKWVFGFMAFVMVLFLVMIPLGSNFGWLGGASSASEQIAADIAKYQAALATNPNDVAALRGLGDTYLSSGNQQVAGSDAQQSDYNAAIAQYEKAVTALEQVKGTDAKAQRVAVLGSIVDTYLFLGDYQSAMNVYPRIIDLKPKDAQLYFDWASVAVSAQDTRIALLAFTRFLELDPTSPQAAAVKQWIADNSGEKKAAPSPTPSPTPSPSSTGGSGS
jgi:tetratricopeptide (TPR) repeat protein